jgi:glutamate synthase (NADPH/NADH) large chain
MTSAEFQRWDGDGIALPIPIWRTPISALLPDAPDLQAGELGVAMCFLPMDISLRAYAIDAITGVVAERGLQMPGRRDVPVRSEAPGDTAFTRPHVAQFFILRPGNLDLDTFERELMLLRAAIEREMAVLGMTSEDVQVVSCSARTLTYTAIAGQDDLAALYPDLDNVQNASVDGRFRKGSHRPQKFA